MKWDDRDSFDDSRLYETMRTLFLIVDLVVDIAAAKNDTVDGGRCNNDRTKRDDATTRALM